MANNCKVSFITNGNGNSVEKIEIDLLKSYGDLLPENYFKNKKGNIKDLDIYDSIVDIIFGENVGKYGIKISANDLNKLQQILIHANTSVQKSVLYKSRDKIIPTYNSGLELTASTNLWFPENIPPVLVLDNNTISKGSFSVFTLDRKKSPNFYICKDSTGKKVIVVEENSLAKLSETFKLLQKVLDLDSELYREINGQLTKINEDIKRINTAEGREKSRKNKKDSIITELDKLQDRYTNGRSGIVSKQKKLKSSITEKLELLQLINKLEKLVAQLELTKNKKALEGFIYKTTEAYNNAIARKTEALRKKTIEITEIEKEIDNLRSLLEKIDNTRLFVKSEDSLSSEEFLKNEDNKFILTDKLKDLFYDLEFLGSDVLEIFAKDNKELINNFIFFNKQYKDFLGEKSPLYLKLLSLVRLIVLEGYLPISDEPYLNNVSEFLSAHLKMGLTSLFSILLLSGETGQRLAEELNNIVKNSPDDYTRIKEINKFLNTYLVNKQKTGLERWYKISYRVENNNGRPVGYIIGWEKKNKTQYDIPEFMEVMTGRCDYELEYKGHYIYPVSNNIGEIAGYKYTLGLANLYTYDNSEVYNSIEEVKESIDKLDINVASTDYSYIEEGKNYETSGEIITVELKNDDKIHHEGDVITYLKYKKGPKLAPQDITINDFLLLLQTIPNIKVRNKLLDLVTSSESKDSKNIDPKKVAALFTYIDPFTISMLTENDIELTLEPVFKNAIVQYYYVTKNSATFSYYRDGKVVSKRRFLSVLKVDDKDKLKVELASLDPEQTSPLISLEAIALTFNAHGYKVLIVDDSWFFEKGIISNGIPARAYTAYGITYLNKNRCSTTDVYHEYSHLLLLMIKTRNADLYDLMMNKFGTSIPNLKTEIEEKRKVYTDESMTDELIIEEMFADLYANYLMSHSGSENEYSFSYSQIFDFGKVDEHLEETDYGILDMSSEGLIAEKLSKLQEGDKYKFFQFFSTEVRRRINNIGFGFTSQYGEEEGSKATIIGRASSFAESDNLDIECD